MSRRSVVAFELEADLDDVRLIEFSSPVRRLAPVLSDGIADLDDSGLVEINDIEDRGLPVLRKEHTGSDSVGSRASSDPFGTRSEPVRTSVTPGDRGLVRVP